MNEQFDTLIDSFLDQKVGIDPQFLTKRLSEGLQENMLRLQHDRLLTAAGTGIGAINNQKIRSDKTCWMDRAHKNIYEQEFLQQAEDLIEYLNRTCYTGINGYEFHYALYEEGSSYGRHRDQFNYNNQRKYSLISYLNENWLEEDGGQLLLYQQEGVQTVLPRSQTAVFFKSDEMEHEVTKATRPRMSISGWLKVVG